MFQKTALITLVITAFLSNSLFALDIEEVESMAKKILPAASSIKEEKLNDRVYYVGCDKDKKKVGFIISSSSQGYESTINFMVGVDMECKVVSYLMSHKETPQYIEKVTKSKFKEQFKGLKKENCELKKNDPVNGKLDAIAGATVSCNSIIDGVKKSLEFAETLLKAEKKEKMKNQPGKMP